MMESRMNLVFITMTTMPRTMVIVMRSIVIMTIMMVTMMMKAMVTMTISNIRVVRILVMF